VKLWIAPQPVPLSLRLKERQNNSTKIPLSDQVRSLLEVVHFNLDSEENEDAESLLATIEDFESDNNDDTIILPREVEIIE
jgi:hypothetical protein